MGGLAKFASYTSAVIGGVLLVLGVITFIDGNPGPTMMLVPLGGVLIAGAVIGGVKINS